MVEMQYPRTLIAAFLAGSFYLSCSHPGRMNGFPTRMLWAWERSEDLRTVDPEKYGVAYLAWTFSIRGETVAVYPRRQPLFISAGTKILAVARVEVDHARPFKASQAQRDQILAGILGALRPEVRGIQIDFDALESERPFYRSLLQELRMRMNPTMPLSMTSLASWALFEDWIRDLPVDEVVPMCFDMGAETAAVRSRIKRGEDFRVPLARMAIGVCLQEPLPRMPGHWWERRRVYVFSHSPWGPASVAKAVETFP